MPYIPNLIDLIKKHRALDSAIRENRERFISDWNGDHPFVESYLGSDLMNLRLERPLPSGYLYFDNEASVLDAIRAFHLKWEGLELARNHIVAGCGSSSMLVAFSLWLCQERYDEVFYVPPLYYTFHYFLRLLNIRSRPVSGRQVFETGSILNLPEKQTVLLLCDPVWFAGRTVPLDKIREIAEWQRRTRSLVFVDGSFQYMQWAELRREQTSILDSELTFRLISPTKSLAIPFFRFAYLLHPAGFHNNFLFLYESIVGGATISDIVFARRSLSILGSDTNNRRLCEFLQSTFNRLVEREFIYTKILPECGYFVFAVPKVRLPSKVVMDQDYFELKNYPEYVRINLMAARHIFEAG
jgi:aspartate/methionine/tyrosine aminotransferase